MDSRSRKKADSTFIGVLIALLISFLSIACILFILSYSSNIVLYKLILNIILILIFLGCFYIVINTLAFIRLLNGKKQVSKTTKRMASGALKLLYPQVLFLSQLLGLEKDKIRAVFSEINNKLILSDGITVKSEEILLLLPHCLQNSSCTHKITNKIDNCKKCGKCNVDSILNIRNEYNIKVHVATGGTLARKIVKEIKPKLIIAVACERDLSSGILDIQGIPVMGILLERPEGPCVNTRVDLSRIREVIKLFLKEDERTCSSIHHIMDSDLG